jgi:CRISPR-associated protein Csb1
MHKITLDLLIGASMAGGASCLTSVTELEPAAGPQASVAPAKFASSNSGDKKDKKGVYAYERRFLDGVPSQAVIIDSKQSQLNRCELALAQAVTDGHPTLSLMPRVELEYQRNGVAEVYSDLTLPHRIFDGHIRAGTVDGVLVTQLDMYRDIRNAAPANARAVLDVSPVSLLFGSWDSSRATRQGRWRSALVGEIIGFCADDRSSLRGGARVDPVGMQIQLTETALKNLAEAQRAELSVKLYDKATAPKPVKNAAKGKGEGEGAALTSGSMLGLGGIPPTLDALSGVACDRIIRSHVLSFAALRQMRFGAGVDGDAACRALLAALALNALARSDSELCLRANCDLREAGAANVAVDERGGGRVSLEPLEIAEADALLAAALAAARDKAGIRWNGVVMRVTGNPAVVAGAVADEDPGAV